MEVLQSYKQEAGNFTVDGTSLRRHDSTVSLQSNTFSVDRSTLREKLNEIETYNDILYNQINSLQRYFDTCAVNLTEKDNFDLKSEAGMLRHNIFLVDLSNLRFMFQLRLKLQVLDC